MITSYKCPNLGNCSKADQAEIVQIPSGAPVKCTECGASLMAVAGAPGGVARSSAGVKSAVAVAGLIVVAVLGACRTWGVESENRPQRGQFLPDLPAHSPAMGQKDGEKWTAAVDLQPTIPKSDRLLAWFLLGNRNGNTVKPADVAIVGNPATATNAGKSAPTPPPQAAQNIPRFHGSNTLGGKLLPELAIAYLKQQGYSNVRRVAGAKDEESFIVGERGDVTGQIEIHAHGSSTAFPKSTAGPVATSGASSVFFHSRSTRTSN